jgi:hypothetical protein
MKRLSLICLAFLSLSFAESSDVIENADDVIGAVLDEADREIGLHQDDNLEITPGHERLAGDASRCVNNGQVSKAVARSANFRALRACLALHFPTQLFAKIA